MVARIGLPYDRCRGGAAPEERTRRRPVRPARRPDGGRGSGRVPRLAPTAGRPQRIRETPSPVAQMALDGRAKSLQGIGKTIEEKIVQIVDDGEIHALDEAEGGRAAGARDLHAPPRPRPEDRTADLEGARDHDRRRPQGGGGGAAAPRPHRPRRRSRRSGSSPRSRRRRAREEPHRVLLGTALPKLRAVVEVLAEHPAADRVSTAGSARRYRETVRDLDIIATASDPPALIDVLLRAAVGRRGRREGTDEGDRHLARRAAVRPPRRPSGVLREPAPALHRVEGAQRGAARGGGATRALGLRVRDHRGRDERGARIRRRGRRLRVPRLRVDPAGAARGARRARARRAAASSRRSSSCPISGATSTRTRRGRTARTRSRRWSRLRRRAGTTTTRSATTRSGCAASGCTSRPSRSTP